VIRRPRRTIPAIVVALIALAGCVVVAVCCLQQVSGHTPLLTWHQVADLGVKLHWHDPAVLAAGAVAAVVGLVLLAGALLPGRPTVLPLRPLSDTASSDDGVSRRGLSETLRHSAVDADGVTAARTRLRGGRALVRITTPLDQPDDVQGVHDRVQQTVSDSLDRVALAAPPRLRVHVRTRQSS
jgi:hypothetical protein